MSIAAGLDKAKTWQREDDRIILQFNSPFASTLVEKESRSIEKIIENQLGWSLKIITAVKRLEERPDETVEEQVELFRSVFRGTII